MNLSLFSGVARNLVLDSIKVGSGVTIQHFVPLLPSESRQTVSRSTKHLFARPTGLFFLSFLGTRGVIAFALPLRLKDIKNISHGP